MLKTKPLPGTKVRCVNTAGYEFLTKGKVYTVVKSTDNLGIFEKYFAYIDDDGDTIIHNTSSDPEEFELVEGDEMQVSNNPSEAEVNTKEETPDEFKVGDVVWCILHGKGKVTADAETEKDTKYPIIVRFSEYERWYTVDGRYNEHMPRTLFFSEPKIEAAVKRPFTPTLVGKTVALTKHDGTITIGKVVNEGEYGIHMGHVVEYKKNIKSIYEVLPENLLDKA